MSGLHDPLYTQFSISNDIIYNNGNMNVGLLTHDD